MHIVDFLPDEVHCTVLNMSALYLGATRKHRLRSALDKKDVLAIRPGDNTHALAFSRELQGLHLVEHVHSGTIGMAFQPW